MAADALISRAVGDEPALRAGLKLGPEALACLQGARAARARRTRAG